MKYLLKYATHNEQESSLLQVTPQISLCKKESHVNYKEVKSSKAQYFTVESLEDNNVITLYQGTQTNVITIKVSIDEGKTWMSYTSAQNTSQDLGTLSKGQRMLFKGTNLRINSDSKIASAIRILTSKTCNLLGNLCSIINENSFDTLVNSPNYNYCFANMFATNIVDEEELSCKVIDATKLAILEPSNTNGNYSYAQTFYGCSTLKYGPKSLGGNMKANYLYKSMFQNCTSLLITPELPSTVVYTQSYMQTFMGCTSLETAKTISATSFASGSSAHFQSMFSGCTNLKNVQDELFMTSINNSTYYMMFMNCTSLTKAPKWNSTNGPNGGYNAMFKGCTSLTTVDEFTINNTVANCCKEMFSGCSSLTYIKCNLPSTSLASSCYAAMFQNCTSLETVDTTLPATTLADSCYYYMFSGCSSLTSAPTTFIIDTISGNNVCYAMFYNCSSLSSTNITINTNTTTANCFRSMFNGCTNLTSTGITTLPATTINSCSYGYMFQNCTSLTSVPSFVVDELVGTYNLFSMFNGCSSLTTISGQINATTTTNYCYSNLFSGCTNLTSTGINSLPATTVASYAYQGMFLNCSKLTNFPSFIVNDIIGTYACEQMFRGCTSLTSVNCQLNSTTLQNYCYKMMFYGCTSLTTSPVSILPATTLKTHCYSQMFDQCKNLTSAPELPALTLVSNCYYYMFRSTKIQSIKAAFTTTPGTSYTNKWMDSVENNSSHIFYKNSAATWNVRSIHGIPSAWTVQTYTP